MNRDQITPAHRQRSAFVYIRQSSERQVIDHQESQRRQRNLVHRAVELGWEQDQIEQIDEDLGLSGSRSQVRPGFDRLIAEAALGRVGIILALEASRFCRGNRDWYHLLDICSITKTLIADSDGLYDPRDHNDRLLLGLKGTMSETELHVMKQRLVEATRERARRGEFRLPLPPGLHWNSAARIVKTPDEQVQSTIELIFDRFERLGSMHQVHGSLADDEITVPTIRRPSGPVTWVRPTYSYVQRLLRNPFYAGAYAYGRRQTEEVLDEEQRPVKRVREMSQSQWHVLIKEHHEGYIDWVVFERNQRQIAANRNGEPHLGAAREGRALLQGLILCGRCGRRMKLSYTRRGDFTRFTCSASREQTGGPLCQDFGGRALQLRIEQLVLEALEPAGVDAMLEAARVHEKVADNERTHWQQRVERAEYEVDLARRQYDEVDPANRLVARELERRFEKALENLDTTQGEANRQIEALARPLDPTEEERLRRYAEDLRELWHAETTRPQDKKRVIRLLIESISVTKLKDKLKLKGEVHWIGGQTTDLELAWRRCNRHAADTDLLELIRTLASEFSDSQIARVLNRRGIRTPKGLTFTANRVAVTRNSNGIEKGPAVPRSGPDIYSVDDAARILDVHATTVVRWVEGGLLKGVQVAQGAPWRIHVTEDDVRRLKVTDAPEGWLSLRAAASALRVSQRTVLQRLNSGKLEGVRVQVGGRSAWRIHVPPDAYDDHPTLF